MKNKQMIKIARKLLQLGWESDEWEAAQDICWPAIEDDGENMIESFVHEIAHSRVVGGCKEMCRPKTTKATANMIRLASQGIQRPCGVRDISHCRDQVDDELLVTAITIRVGSLLGINLQTLALDNVIRNIPKYMSNSKSECMKRLEWKRTQTYAQDIADYMMTA